MIGLWRKFKSEEECLGLSFDCISRFWSFCRIVFKGVFIVVGLLL